MTPIQCSMSESSACYLTLLHWLFSVKLVTAAADLHAQFKDCLAGRTQKALTTVSRPTLLSLEIPNICISYTNRALLTHPPLKVYSQNVDNVWHFIGKIVRHTNTIGIGCLISTRINIIINSGMEPPNVEHYFIHDSQVSFASLWIRCFSAE